MTTLSAAGIDTRNVAEPMEECQPPDTRECTEAHDRIEPKESRDKEDKREPKDTREGRERENKDGRDAREVHTREPREHRDREHREHRELRESREMRDPRDFRDVREQRDPRDLMEPHDLRESRALRESRDMREHREPRELREPRDSRETRDPREHREREYREVPEASPPRISPLLSVRRFRSETSAEALTPTHPTIPKDEPPDEPMRPSSPEDDTISLRSNGAQNDNMGRCLYFFISTLVQPTFKILITKCDKLTQNENLLRIAA